MRKLAGIAAAILAGIALHLGDLHPEASLIRIATAIMFTVGFALAVYLFSTGREENRG
jgi:hypothetical protein